MPLLALLFWSAGTDPAGRAPADTLAIEHVTVLPMTRDTALVDHTVLVSGERIVWLGPSGGAPTTSGRRVNAAGLYLMPGLADMHVHLDRGVADLPLYLGAGITTIRNMNGRPEHLEWKKQVAAGGLAGPRIYTAGTSIRGSLLPTRRFVRLRTTRDAERLVEQYQRAGYDQIKVLNDIDLPVYQHLLRRAKSAGIPVVGHVVSGIGIARSLAAGQVSFEHAEPHLHDNDESRLQESAQAIARAGAWVGTIISDREGRCAPPSPTHRRIIAALRNAGVRLLAGSDSGLDPIEPGPGLHCELASLVQAGLTPYQALETATRNPGEFARIHLREPIPFGTVTVGARADLLFLRSDPRTDIGAIGDPAGAVIGGGWHPR